MDIEVKKNKVSITTEDLNIYVAMDLKEVFDELNNKGEQEVSLDISKASSISTPLIQVILSAKKTFKNFTLNKNIASSVTDDTNSLGIKF
ncbi:MAG: hypothetical protein KAT46_05205 [Deltaproteobacteria bacterium]|nr:hypothetical protein [Deltaproteobacteria bacterium]